MRDEIGMVHEFHCKLDLNKRQLLRKQSHEFSKDDASLLGTAIELESLAKRHLHLMRPDDLRHVRAHLLIEEVGEFVEGLAHYDEVKVLNALADIVYVAFGASLVFDLPLTEEFHETHASNMTKERQPSDPHADRVRVKGPNYREPDTAGVLRRYRCAQSGYTSSQADSPRESSESAT